MEINWMKSGIDTKAKINKTLEARAREKASKAKGTAMADCFVLWKEREKAGSYDKSGYLDFIQSVSGIDDVKYDKLVQIKYAVNNNKSWSVLQGMIQHLL